MNVKSSAAFRSERSFHRSASPAGTMELFGSFVRPRGETLGFPGEFFGGVHPSFRAGMPSLPSTPAHPCPGGFEQVLEQWEKCLGRGGTPTEPWL